MTYKIYVSPSTSIEMTEDKIFDVAWEHYRHYMDDNRIFCRGIYLNEEFFLYFMVSEGIDVERLFKYDVFVLDENEFNYLKLKFS